MADEFDPITGEPFVEAIEGADRLSRAYDRLEPQMRELQRTADGFARTMTRAFAGAVSGGKQFDDVLKSLVLRLSDMALKAAFAPLSAGLASGIDNLFSGLFGGIGGQVTAAGGAIKPFAAGGVIGAPTYFPLSAGGVGLAGEAGPEAIMPLARGPDGRLGISTVDGSGPSQVTINISTPDAASFRGAEVYLTGQIARAVSRGQRGL